MKKLSKEFDIPWWEECNSKRLSREKSGPAAEGGNDSVTADGLFETTWPKGLAGLCPRLFRADAIGRPQSSQKGPGA